MYLHEYPEAVLKKLSQGMQELSKRSKIALETNDVNLISHKVKTNLWLSTIKETNEYFLDMIDIDKNSKNPIIRIEGPLEPSEIKEIPFRNRGRVMLFL